MKIAIVGGGASGLYCALILKKLQPSLDVTILEKNDKCGKKILMSGNGRGNISNLNMDNNLYNNDLGYYIARLHQPKDLMDDLKKLGLLTYSDSEGRVYPISETANSVLDCFRMWNQKLGVEELTGCEVDSIKPQNQGYLISFNGKEDYFDDVIVACGTNAGYGKSEKESLFENNLKKLNYTFKPIYPSLSPLFVQENIRSLSGLRVEATASLWLDDKMIYSNQGEVLFKDDSLSGILIFQLSTFYARAMVDKKPKHAIVKLDILPQMDYQTLVAYFIERRQQLIDHEISQFTTGLFHKTIGQFLLKKAKFNLDKQIKSLTDGDLASLALLCKELDFEIDMNKRATNFQVYSGGLKIENLLPNSLESKRHKGLYFLGEYLDVDGICGGYNLHFAFASAFWVAHKIVGDISV